MEEQIETAKLLRILKENVQLKLSELAIPDDIKSYFQKLASISEEEQCLPKGISDAEYKFVLALQSNLFHKRQELDWAIGLMLLFSELGPDTPYFWLWETFGDFEKKGKPRAEYNFDFWQSVGDCTVKACSFFDALGGYLSFVFFGLTENRLYYNDVIDAIKVKYSEKSTQKKWQHFPLIEDPFNLDRFVGWEVLRKSRKMYQDLKIWRNVIVHNFSPLLRTKWFDWPEEDSWFDSCVPFLAERSALEVKSSLIEHYFFSRLAKLGAEEIAQAYCGTDSYHRNFYHDTP